MAGVEAEENCFLIFEKVLPSQSDDHFLLASQAVTQRFLYPTLTQQIFLICKFCKHIKGEYEPFEHYWFSSTNSIIAEIKNPMK